MSNHELIKKHALRLIRLTFFVYFQYLTLLRSIAGALELEDIGGLRSMAHIPQDERHRLAGERETACELVASRVKVLKERIQRKDELLQGYEKDLAKLRQAEALADHKHAQVESLSVSTYHW